MGGRTHGLVPHVTPPSTICRGLVDIGACLGPLARGQRQQALDYAAARYIEVHADAAKAIVLLLARAGANLERARAIHCERGNGFAIR